MNSLYKKDMCLNPVNEEYDRAYANVGLLASDVWSFQSEFNDYKRANSYLWVRFNELELRLTTELSDGYHPTLAEDTKKVQRNINNVSLTGQFPTNNLSYYADIDKPFAHIENSEETHNTEQSSQGIPEVWLLPEVENELNFYTHVKPFRLLRVGQDIAPAKQVATVCPAKWLTRTKWPRKLLLSYPSLPTTLQEAGNMSLFNEDLYMPYYSESELAEKLEEFPCPTYQIQTNADLELHSRINSVAVRRLWPSLKQRHDGLNLNADIPEFVPLTSRPLQYQSIYDTSYEVDLFPYMNIDQRNEDLFNIYCKEEEPLRTLPVFSMPPNLYYNFENEELTWENHQEEISSNIRCDIKKDGKASKRALNAEQTLAFLDKWLSQIYYPRSNDFMTISSTTHKIDTIIHNIHQNYLLSQNEIRVGYGSNSKFEELEREALEQYTGSDNSLTLEKIQHNINRESQDLPPPQWPITTEEEMSCSPFFGISCDSHLASRRSSIEEFCCLNKQSMWMKKKNKKSSKTKRSQKHKKKTLLRYSYNCIEPELELINMFIKFKELYTGTFYSSNWNLVQTLLVGEVEKSFNICLKIIEEYSEWFKMLIIQNYLKKDFIKNTKRLELAKNIVDSLHGLVSFLNHYMSCYLKIKTIISNNLKLLYNPEKINIHMPVLPIFEGIIKYPSILSFEEYFEISVNKSAFDNETLYSLIFLLRSGNYIKQEWQLSDKPEPQVSTNFSCIQVKNGVGKHNFVLDQTQPIICKTILLAEDCPVWRTWQWMFTDGWKFTDNDTSFSFHWFNQFTAISLEKAVSSIRDLVFDKWFLEFLVSISKEKPKIELIWNVESANWVKSKVAFLTLLIQQEENWCFNQLWLNKYPCTLRVPSCKDNCSFSWLLNCPKITSRPVANNKKCGEPREFKTHIESKISDIPAVKKFPNKQLILKKKILVPEKTESLNQHSNCVLQ